MIPPSLPTNPHRFDRGELVKSVCDRVENRWRSHFSLANPTWHYVNPESITAAAAVNAAQAIRGLIDQPLTNIASRLGGLLGEQYPPDRAIARADEFWLTQVTPQAERLRAPPENVGMSGADPVWIIRECIIVPLWTEEFFKPLTPYTEELRAGFVAAMRASDNAKPIAGDLLNQLAATRISKDREEIDKALSAAAAFLERFVPTRRDSTRWILLLDDSSGGDEDQDASSVVAGTPQLLALKEFSWVCRIPMGTLVKKTKSLAKPIVPHKGSRPATYLYHDLCDWCSKEWPHQAGILPKTFEEAWTIVRAAAQEEVSRRKHPPEKPQ